VKHDGNCGTVRFPTEELEMRKHLPLFLRLALLLAFAFNVVAQTEHITPFTGTWKLNLAKSRFNPGPPFRSFTLTFTA